MKNNESLFITVILLSVLISCNRNTERDKAQIIQTENEFAMMAEENGIAVAFHHFAADSAVILRGGRLIKGKEAIRDYYNGAMKPGTKLKWAPDFTDVSGDLGYTYGRYTHLVPDTAGIVTESHGIFHTVWKRQADGSWRFVWD
jgi:ketosteroid isomerase-like protein